MEKGKGRKLFGETPKRENFSRFSSRPPPSPSPSLSTSICFPGDDVEGGKEEMFLVVDGGFFSFSFSFFCLFVLLL